MNKQEFLTKAVFSGNSFTDKMTCEELRSFTDSIFGSDDKEETSSNGALSLDPVSDGKGGIFIPLLGRTIAVDSIENEEKYNWKQAMDYCKEHGLELPSKDDALILLWQFDKINALLRSLGKPEISKESWFWTKTESSATNAWLWYSGSWNNYHKYRSYAVVPFFAI